MATYLPDAGGEWIAAVRGTTILFARAASVGDVLALWPELLDPDPAAAVLDHVTASGVSATPPFALVVRDPESSSTRVVVRGPIHVRVGEVEVDGDGVTTWTERVLPGGEVAVASARTASGVDASPLPIVEGIVTAREVRSGGVEPTAPGSVEAAAVGASAVSVGAAPAAAAPPSSVDERTVVRDGAAEQTIVPDEDTIVGVSVPVRPFAPSADRPATPPAGPAPTPPAGRVATPPAGRVATQERIEAPAAAPHTEPVAASTITIGTPPPSSPAAPGSPAGPDSSAAPEGDHDGLTIASDDIRRLREARGAAAATAAEGAAASDPPLIEQVGLRMPDGTIEPVVDAVVLGRAPTIGKLSGGRVPRLVVIGAGDPDISRSHLRVALEGGTVVVTDLDSRNGTHVVAPGRLPVKLRPAEPTPVLTETVIDLGGGWTIQVVTR
ncbi:FHA domain-containing protein [Agromyces tardus]|uniref:FHA domain-containing protein n=1 Tax=Agromyces tardus TaxID=2583849 RepID=UPI00110C673A|nr:FHA domain-containing protein [Agromyces tardus]